MKPAITRISAILIALLMVVSLLPAAVFAVSDRTVSYEVQNASGVQQTKVAKDAAVSVIVRVSDSAISLDPALPAADQLNAYKLNDSFFESSESAVNYGITSANSYTLTFTNLRYSGTGQSFVFKTSEDGKTTYSKETLTIDETVVYVAPPEEPEIEYVPTPCDPPVVIISIASAPEIIKAGDAFEVKFNIENKSNRPLSDVYANFTTTGDYRIDGYTTKLAVENIGSKKSAQVTAKFLASDALDAEYVTLGVELQYTYNNYVQTTNGSASETFYLTAQKKAKEEEEPPKEVIPEPVVIVTGSVIDVIKEKQDFEYTVFFENKGKTALTNCRVKLSAGNDLRLRNESSTVLLNDIPAGGKGSVTLKLKAGDTISSNVQTVSVSLRYYYDNGSGSPNLQGSVDESFDLFADVSKQQGDSPTVIASPVPNVIITDYSFGGESVIAGEPFDLNVTFKNTGRVAIENIVVVINGGQHFTINGATNTLYYTSVGAGAEQTMTVPLQTLATAATGAQPVAVSFQYEYVDSKVRSQNSANIDISVPVSQPDRLEFGEPVMYDWMAYTGMETTIVLDYVNKGKSEVSNVEAEVAGNVDALQQSQYLGNFGSGMSGNISFVVTPWEAGTTEVTFNITYEDANGNTVTREIPYSFEVQDMVYDDPGQWEDPGMWEDPVVEKQGFIQTMPWWGWVIAAAVVLAVLIIVLKSVKKRKAKKAVKAAESEWNVFDEVGENKEA